jgi:uncharacterized membrane protein
MILMPFDLTQVSFMNTPGPLALVLIPIGILVFLLLTFWRLSVQIDWPMRLALLAVRAILLSLILIIIADPFAARSGQGDWLGVLIDTSQSMEVRDSQMTAGRLSTLRKYLLEDPTWKKIKDQKVRKVFCFDSSVRPMDSVESLGGETNFREAVLQLDKTYRNDPKLLGFVVFSDGGATDMEGANADFAGIVFPWISVLTADTEKVLNVSLNAPPIPRKVFVGEKIPLKVTWNATAVTDQKTVLKLKIDGEPKQEFPVDFSKGTLDIEWAFDSPADHSIELDLVPLKNEGSSADNHVKLWVEAVSRKIKVFYSESYYKGENYFKKALEEDRDFEVTFAASVVGFAKKNGLPFIQDANYGLPRSKEKMFEYDAIVLSDVNRNLLSDDQVLWIVDLVEKEGGALVMIGGMDSFGDGGYVKSEIEKVLPVEISEEYKSDTFLKARGTVENAFRPVVSGGHVSSPYLKLSKDLEQSKAWWETLPILGGYNYVGRLRPGAQSLLEHPRDQSVFGPRVILAVQNYGKGRVLAFMSDITPNWGEKFQEWRNPENEWLYGIFWRTVIKELVSGRARERSEPFPVKVEPDFIEEGEPITFKAMLRPESFGIDDTARILFEVSKDGAVLFSKKWDEIRPDEKNSWTIDGLLSGDYDLHGLVTSGERPPLDYRAKFSVHASRKESRHLRGTLAPLSALARNSRGRFLKFSQLNDLPDVLKLLEKRHLEQQSAPLWQKPWVYFLLLSIWMLDCALRKRAGLE